MPNIQCPHCETTVKVPASKAGQRVRCPKCQEMFEAPDDDDEEDKGQEDQEDDDEEQEDQDDEEEDYQEERLSPLKVYTMPPIFQWLKIFCWIHLVCMAVFSVAYVITAIILSMFVVGLPMLLGFFFLPGAFIPGFFGLAWIEVVKKQVLDKQD